MISGSRVLRAAVCMCVCTVQRVSAVAAAGAQSQVGKSVCATLDRNNELWDGGQDLDRAALQQVQRALHGEEAVRLLLLTQAIKEDGQVVMVVELLTVDLPADVVARGRVLHANRQVAPVVEAAELGRGDRALLERTGHGLGCGLQARQHNNK